MFEKDHPINTIPILIDDIKNYPSFPFTRCNYFVIESLDPQPHWILDIRGQDLPILLINLTVIITCSMRKGFFHTRMDIEKLFQVIENAGFYVDTNDLWIPNRLLDRNRRDKRGDVYRISKNLFSIAVKFRQSLMEQSDFQEKSSDMVEQVFYMEEETKAFSQFEDYIINELIETYPKNKELALSWVENDSTFEDTL